MSTTTSTTGGSDIDDRLDRALVDRFVDNDLATIHYMAGGTGPLVVFVHGYPDYWYTWHHQIDGLLDTHSVAAVDLRGCNLSDAPTGTHHYGLDQLASDIVAVIDSERHDTATIIGHDWGGVIAWHLALHHDDRVDRLVVANAPHPASLRAALDRPDSAQRAALAYTDTFIADDSEDAFDPVALADFRARTPGQRARYLEAFSRSDPAAMMNLYRQNPPRSRTSTDGHRVAVPVLQFHGLDDPALLADSIGDTWTHLDNTWNLVTIPGTGHWPHQDQPDLVTTTIRDWLLRPASAATTPPSPATTTAATSASTTAACCADTARDLDQPDKAETPPPASTCCG